MPNNNLSETKLIKSPKSTLQKTGDDGQNGDPVGDSIQPTAKLVGAQKGLARGFSLSSKLLMWTLIFVMLAEVLIFLPSIGNYRKNWLKERLSAAHIAALAVRAAPNNQVPEKLRWELLNRAQVYSVALKLGDQRVLILQSPMPTTSPPDYYDLREQNFLTLVRDAISVYFDDPKKMIRVVGKPEMSDAEFIEVLMVQGPLRRDMIRYALNILALSILISLFTAALVYLALNRLLVRPIGQLTESMMHFSENPENPDGMIRPSGRRDEIGTAENELLAMQQDLSTMLTQKTRLANLGIAVSKINHDLRGMLSTAHLVSDRLQSVDDPTVQRITPRLVRSIDRAIKLCSDTLQYGKTEERKPNRTTFAFKDLIGEVLEEQDLPRSHIGSVINIEGAGEIYGDYEQLYRVFSNLIRNSVEALEGMQNGVSSHAITISLKEGEKATHIAVEDTGPGLSSEAREHLFEAFKGSSRRGGTGLGLAIAAEIVRSHNGAITYNGHNDEAASGAYFEIVLPAPNGSEEKAPVSDVHQVAG